MGAGKFGTAGSTHPVFYFSEAAINAACLTVRSLQTMIVALVFSVRQILCPLNLPFVLRAVTETLKQSSLLWVSAGHASRTEPTLGTVIGTRISSQSFAFFFQQFVNALNEFNQSRWVLLDGCLLTQHNLTHASVCNLT